MTQPAPLARPLECGQVVTITAGPHAGKRGVIREIVKEYKTARSWLMVELDEGIWVRVDCTLAPGVS